MGIKEKAAALGARMTKDEVQDLKVYMATCSKVTQGLANISLAITNLIKECETVSDDLSPGFVGKLQAAAKALPVAPFE